MLRQGLEPYKCRVSKPISECLDGLSPTGYIITYTGTRCVFRSATELAQVLARACGHAHLNGFCVDDLTTWDHEMARLTGIAYGGVALD